MFAPRSLAERLRPGTRLRRLPVPSRIALAVLLVVVLGAVFAPLLTQDPLATGTPALPPGADHWFGTDRAGRDVFARVVHGARYSLVIGFGATLLALAIGSSLGALAATSRKFADESVMRTLDVVMSFPPIALAAVLVAVFGASVPVIIFTIAFVYSPSLARVVRANVLEQYGEDYVAAEQVVGARRHHIVARHVAVNCAAPVLVFATVMVADSIIFEASLSFIGAGVQDPDPSWGSVLAYGRQILLSGGWWATLFPGLCLLITVLALNVLSEGMTDAAASRTRPAPTAVTPSRRSPPPSLRPAGPPPTPRSPSSPPGSRPRKAPCRRWPRTPPTCSSYATCRSASPTATATSPSSTASPSPSARARRWDWSASRAAASRSPAWPSWACWRATPRRPARSSTGAVTC